MWGQVTAVSLGSLLLVHLSGLYLVSAFLRSVVVHVCGSTHSGIMCGSGVPLAVSLLGLPRSAICRYVPFLPCVSAFSIILPRVWCLSVRSSSIAGHPSIRWSCVSFGWLHRGQLLVVVSFSLWRKF